MHSRKRARRAQRGEAVTFGRTSRFESGRRTAGACLGPRRNRSLRKLLAHQIQEVPPGAILRLHDPRIGVELNFLAEPLVDPWLRHRLL